MKLAYCFYFLLLSLTCSVSLGWTNKYVNCKTRRDFLSRVTQSSICLSSITIPLLTNPHQTWARNLPESNGADLSATGTVLKLIPIVEMKQILLDATSTLSSSSSTTMTTTTLQSKQSNNNKNNNNIINDAQLQTITNIIKYIPTNEKQFKRIFDEYSDPVSYKQKYMDSNAFLIYYTNGYDGPDRESIEKDIPRQTLQYGARNDIWNAFEEFMVELKFSDTNTLVDDILVPLNKAINGLDVYLSLAPQEDVEKAQSQLKKL